MQPKIYSLDDHRIAQDKIDQHASYVIHKLRQAGYKAYLVGGGVRDLLLNQTPKDFDISTSARPEEVRALFRNAILIGRLRMMVLLHCCALQTWLLSRMCNETAALSGQRRAI